MRVAKIVIRIGLDPYVSIRNQIGDQDPADRKLLEVGLSMKNILRSDSIASKHRHADVAILTEGTGFGRVAFVVPMGRPIRHQPIEGACFNPLPRCRRDGHYCCGDCLARMK